MPIEATSIDVGSDSNGLRSRLTPSPCRPVDVDTSRRRQQFHDPSPSDRGVSVQEGEHPLGVCGDVEQEIDEPIPVHRSRSRSPATATRSYGGASLPKSPQAVLQSEEAAPMTPVPWPITSTCSVCDWSMARRLGFSAPQDEHHQRVEEDAHRRIDEEETQRDRHFSALCAGVTLLAGASPETLRVLRQAARQYGVPSSLRAVVWLTLTGAATKMDENEYFCRAILHRHGYAIGRQWQAIEADLERTFPGHPYFSEADVGLYKLKNLLHALCWRNPLVNYCQSFNCLAGFALLVLDDEERCFWLLLYLLETLLPNDFFNESLLGAKVDQVVLTDLIQQRLPKVADHFRALQFDPGVLLSTWGLSMFVGTFPVETVLVMWDYLFVMGEPGQKTSAHLEIILATVKLLERSILRCEDVGELMGVLRRETSMLYDGKALLQMARRQSISISALHELRRERKPLVSQELSYRQTLRDQQREARAAAELRWLASQPDQPTPTSTGDILEVEMISCGEHGGPTVADATVNSA